jgi:hypothetical protein
VCKNLKNSFGAKGLNFIKICPMGVELFHTGQKDRHDVVNSPLIAISRKRLETRPGTNSRVTVTLAKNVTNRQLYYS